MAEKNLHISELLDIYGGLLTEKQQRLTSLYYEEDLSLGEIAENEAITRQGARDFIKRSENQLVEYERVLNVLDMQAKTDKLINSIRLICEKNLNIGKNSDFNEILDIINDYER